MSGGRRVILVLAALCALVAKIAIAYNTYGTNDAMTFEADIAKLQSAGAQELYRNGVEPAPGHMQVFSHSPPVIHGLLLLHRLETHSGLPVRFWIRVCCALADMASLGLLWKMGIRSAGALLLTALAPASLMISGFHVNTDPLVACAVLGSAYLICSRRFVWAGAALGVAVSLKILALVFVPALAIAAGAKRSAAVAGVALLCFCTLSLPFIWEFPKTIATSMLAYRGLYNYWGIAGISRLIGTDGGYQWYRRPGEVVALSAVAVAVAVVGHRGRRGDILRNCGLSAALFLLLTPGFGVQYLAYLVPWLAVARSYVRVAFGATSGAFLAALYSWGSNGFPWYSANFFLTRFMPAHVFLLELLTWFAVGIAAAGFARRAPVSGSRSELPNSRAERHGLRRTRCIPVVSGAA
jgi:hypothetical protein